ncbi:MAG: cob(I)yrinic acid a,c-diamide adenosyltransferase [Firmicutes bacterium]|nr:cob(I)yrinic acid a,c-diamide adenosyltransferase [Bacillota bacterium]
MIHIYCGDGKGKTTASVGLAMRMAGYNKRVLFIQFLKGSYTGELEALDREKNITVMRCDENYGFFRSMSEEDKENIIKCHNKNLLYAKENADKFDMIVLDEIFAAYNYGLTDKDIVREIVKDYGGELVMTGRGPDRFFTEKADYVSEIKKIKHPYDRGITARKGIEF